MGKRSSGASTRSARAGVVQQHQAQAIRSPDPLSLSLPKAARIAGLTLLLAGCSKGTGSGLEEGEKIACALAGSQQFAPDCAVERSTVDGAGVFIVRLPDDAFHRFALSKDGQTLTAADGADQAQAALKGDKFEVILGQNRFVIPAKAAAR